MKFFIAIAILLCCHAHLFAQTRLQLLTDSALLSNGELVIKNSTDTINGFLFNTGSGHTAFKHGLIKVNDSVYVIGADTLKIKSGTSAAGWSLTGNSGTNPSTNFIGTTDSKPLNFRIENSSAGTLDTYGNVAFGMGYDVSGAGTAGYNTAIGSYAIATSTVSFGGNNVALGAWSEASGEYNSTTVGGIATNVGSSAFGGGSEDSAYGGVAVGAYTTIGANAIESIAVGLNSQCSYGFNNIAIGYNTHTSGYYSVGIGTNVIVGNDNAFVIGDSAAPYNYRPHYPQNVGFGVPNPQKRIHIDARNLATYAADFLEINGLAPDTVRRYTTKVLSYDSTTGIVGYKTVTAGGGGLSSFSATGSNGITVSVANPTTTPSLTLGLGSITPSSVQTSSITITGSFTGRATDSIKTGYVLPYAVPTGSATDSIVTYLYGNSLRKLSASQLSGLSATGITAGTLGVTHGGTGLATTTAYGVITGGTTATGNLQNAGTGTSGQVLTSAGSSALPTWQNAPVFGSASLSGNGSTKIFTVTHGMGRTPTQVIITPTTSTNFGYCYISAKSSTTFTVTYATAPTTGTGNITFDWVAK